MCDNFGYTVDFTGKMCVADKFFMYLRRENTYCGGRVSVANVNKKEEEEWETDVKKS